MSRERLELIIRWVNEVKATLANRDKLYKDDEDNFDWLIKQAERVQELEVALQKVTSSWSKKVEEIKKLEKKQLQNAYDLKSNLYDELNKDYVKVREENKRLREALEFYADEETHKEILISEASYDADGICVGPDEHGPPIIYFDKGEVARQALSRSDCVEK